MKVLIDNGAGYVDYTRYVVDGSLTVSDSINVSTLVDFTLMATDNTFQPPAQSAYVRVVSERYASGNSGGYGTGKVLATGFVTNLSSTEYMGLSPHLPARDFQQLSYKVTVSSDEWLLNTRAVPYIPAFINQTQGQILGSIAQTLAPGFFDVTSFVASGDIVPYYQYSPDKTWSDIAKDFGDSQRFRYKVVDKVVYYQPFGDQPLGIAYDERKKQQYFSPVDLSTSVVTVPPVNDVIVTGDTEPQTNWENYFVGDGFTSKFRLLHQAFDGSTALLLQDDWTETSFQTNLWTINDPLHSFALAGALNIDQIGFGGITLNSEYIVGVNGFELGGGLALQHGEFAFQDRCEGLVGGLYLNTTLSQANCVAGFNLSTSGTFVPTVSGAAGIIMQPVFNGQLVGPIVVSQPNHHYLLQTLIGANAWNRYERIYKNLTGEVSFGGNYLSASGTITWMITDFNLGIYAVTQPGFAANAITNPVTSYTVQQQDLPEFAVYAPINCGTTGGSAYGLNLTVNYTLVNQPPEGALYVRSLTGATGLQLPVLPQNLSQEYHYLQGFGQQNQTATITDNGDTSELDFYDTTIPGVGARIRHQSWSAGQSVSRVQDPVSVAQQARVSGDSGIRSAIMPNLVPLPRTSAECELAAGAAITDRAYPQFQGNYMVETLPYRFETLYNPGMYGYPKSGEFLYINATQRGVSGQNFFVQGVQTQIIDLREENLIVNVAFGPDLYLENLLQSFNQRTDSLLTPKQSAPPLTPLALSLVGNYFLDTPDNAKITNISNSLTGNYVTIDLGAPPVTGVEVRRVDQGWGTQDSNFIGVFTGQTFNLPRAIRDQTWYVRYVNGGQYSRFSKALRVAYPMVPSAPNLIASTSASLVFNFNGDVRDIYGLELSASGGNQLIASQPPTGPAIPLGILVRFNYPAYINAVQQGNVVVGYNPQTVPPNNPPAQQFIRGDIVYLSVPVDASFGGFRTVHFSVPADFNNGTTPYEFGYYETWSNPAPVIVGTNTAPYAYLYSRPSTYWAPTTATIAVGGLATLTTNVNHTLNTGDAICMGVAWASGGGVPNVPGVPNYTPATSLYGNEGPLCGLFQVVSVPAANQFRVQIPTTDPHAIYGAGPAATIGTISPMPPNSVSQTLGAGTLLQRPVFSNADLIVNMQDPNIVSTLEFFGSQSSSGRVGGLLARFFNLTWDYSQPTVITTFATPAVSGLQVVNTSQALTWVNTMGVPLGARVTTSDPVTGTVYNKFTVDHPDNKQTLSQAPLPSSDFVNARTITVTPFDAIGDGTPTTIQWMGASANGILNPLTYTIGVEFIGQIPVSYTLLIFPLDQQITFYANMGPSRAVLGTATTSSMTMSLKKNGVQFGTVNWGAGATVGTFSSTTTTFAIGDVITLVTSNTFDATAANVGLALSATKG